MLDFLSKSSRLFGKLYKFSFETSCISMRCEYEPKRDTLITVGFSELKLYHLQNGLVFEMSRRYTIKKTCWYLQYNEIFLQEYNNPNTFRKV